MQIRFVQVVSVNQIPALHQSIVDTFLKKKYNNVLNLFHTCWQTNILSLLLKCMTMQMSY